MSGCKSLPVLMHHYISRHPNTIAVTPELFREQCEGLAEAGWKGIRLAEAEAFLAQGAPLPPRSCLITFDDGYLDNYVYAWPILAEYGHKGTIFAVTERINEASQNLPADAPRATLADIRDNTYPEYALPDVDHPDHDTPFGYSERRDQFFTWTEARRMEESGVIQVAAHSMRHQSVFIGDNFTSFILPGHPFRTFGRPRDCCWGIPNFAHKAGLANRAFIPSDELVSAVTSLVPQDDAGAFAFSKTPGHRQELSALVARMAGKLGRMENDGEMRERLYEELASGKTIMEKELGHTVKTLCWPWGEFSETALNIGRELGFTVFVTTEYGPNPPGNPLAVRRFKVKQKSASWLLTRVRIFSHPLLGALYAKCRI